MKKQIVAGQVTTNDTFSLSFDGNSEIEASLLGLTISNMAYVVNEIAVSDESEPECHLRVNAFKKGSFEIVFTAAVVVGQLALNYSLGDATAVFNILKSIFDIKKLLKGEKPLSVVPDEKPGYVQVASPGGTVVIAPIGSKIVISDVEIDRRISQISQAAQMHNPDGGFTLSRKDEVVHFDRDAVQAIALTAPMVEFLPSDTVHTSEVTLPIRKPDLLGDAAWTFMYMKRPIQVSIADQEFLKSVHDGKVTCKAGDMLAVELTTRIKLSGDGIPQRETYTIDKVRGHIPANNQPIGEQTKL